MFYKSYMLIVLIKFVDHSEEWEIPVRSPPLYTSLHTVCGSTHVHVCMCRVHTRGMHVHKCAAHV